MYPYKRERDFTQKHTYTQVHTGKGDVKMQQKDIRSPGLEVWSDEA